MIGGNHWIIGQSIHLFVEVFFIIILPFKLRSIEKSLHDVFQPELYVHVLFLCAMIGILHT